LAVAAALIVVLLNRPTGGGVHITLGRGQGQGPAASGVNPVNDIAEYAKSPQEKQALEDALTFYNQMRETDATGEDVALHERLSTFEPDVHLVNRWVLDFERIKGFGE
jgi:hypothetical protein